MNMKNGQIYLLLVMCVMVPYTAAQKGEVRSTSSSERDLQVAGSSSGLGYGYPGAISSGLYNGYNGGIGYNNGAYPNGILLNNLGYNNGLGYYNPGYGNQAYSNGLGYNGLGYNGLGYSSLSYSNRLGYSNTGGLGYGGGLPYVAGVGGYGTPYGTAGGYYSNSALYGY